MKCVPITVDGWIFGMYEESAAARVAEGIGPRAQLGDPKEVQVLEPVRIDHYETDTGTRHRMPWQALKQARKYGCYAYAVRGDQRFLLKIHRGPLNERRCVSEPRYMIDGVEYALCKDSHFEPTEGYTAVVIGLGSGAGD